VNLGGCNSAAFDRLELPSQPLRSLSSVTTFEANSLPKDRTMACNPSETVIDLYRRHAVQWDAARRSSVWNDRVWIKAFAHELARVAACLISAAAARPSRVSW
jgi:hypothetical protein